MRAGYAFAEGAALHGAASERHFVREQRSAWLWALAIPLAALIAYSVNPKWIIAVLIVYPLQIVRLALRGGRSARENWWHATFLVLGKFPEMTGQIKFWLHRLIGRRAVLIEYK